MKLVILLIIGGFLHLSAASYSQTVTLKGKNLPLAEVLQAVRQQTGYGLVGNMRMLEDSKSVTVSATDMPLEKFLKTVFINQPLGYRLLEKNIMVERRKQPVQEEIKNLQNISVTVTGRITDTIGRPLLGATISIKNKNIAVIANGKGEFSINAQSGDVLVISFIGYVSQTLKVTENFSFLSITLHEASSSLNEVVVSNGYQTIPKERATGSFILIDSALLNRRVSTNILDRLDGVTSGLIFNKNKISNNTSDISVRGRSTISSNTAPLIILDNFPYDGDISNINPQEVKSISVLKDGAAASIWGSRAGNGVIVITTYKGAYNQKPLVSFSSNVTIGNKPDLYYKPQLTNQQFIGIEQFLFDKGDYNTIIDNGYGALSPAVAIMLSNRNGTITTDQKKMMLDSIAGFDNRADLSKYLYRRSVNQQYQFGINGGGQNNKYYISMGYDKDLANIVTTSNDRLTLNANNTINLLKNKIELYTGILFTHSNNKIDGRLYQPRYPYERIADQNGSPLAVTDGNLSTAYVDTAGAGRLLDWHYRPLEELRNGYSSYHTDLTDYRINLGLTYKIIPMLKFSASYTYDKGSTDEHQNNSIDSYYTRNQINTFTQISSGGFVTYPIPLGAIITNNTTSYFSHYGRGQLNFDNVFNKRHAVSALAGFEVKDYQSSLARINLYGYNNETAANGNAAVNPTVFYPYFYGSNSARIPLNINNVGTIDRYRSYFINGSYALDNKYIVSASARRDESNLFGVTANQKGVPLWSAGVSWNISNETFYNRSFLPYLKLRATYGYNGNINKSVSAYLTAISNGLLNGYGQPFIDIQNPPNPSLRWERVKNINIGIDFSTKNNVVSGSVEYWIKDGLDLIGATPAAPQTGVTVFTGNSANMHGQGIDITLNSRNIVSENFSWTSNFIFNYNTDKITSYKVKATSNSNILGLNYIQPLEGYSYYALFSYKWMGLDNQGMPQGTLNGNISKDYSAIANSTNAGELVYSGTLSPKFYGSLINTLSWKALQLSFNFVYKLGYVYRRPSLNSISLYNNPNGASTYQQYDYDLRWQKPGDELTTNVPALIYPVDGAAYNIYYYSDILVEKADHIRLQDIRLNYLLSKGKLRFLPFSNINIYAYASNLGVVWRASKYKIDPDYPYDTPLPKMYSLGIKLKF